MTRAWTGPHSAHVPAVDTQYRDTSLPVEQRVENLLAQMTLEEKAGLLFHPMITMNKDGTLSNGDPEFGLPATEDYVVGRHINHFNIPTTVRSARLVAQWHNRLQELAASTRLGIPVTISSDPRHSFSSNPLTGALPGAFSVWPETLGLGAIGDEDLVERFGDIVRQEYLAVGIRVALHPQIDLATEPRWARQIHTFGEDPDLTSRLGAAYIRGIQGATFGPDSVSTMAKHFPGGGPQKDGEDPHFDYGREQVYPGGRFETHLKPFEAAIRAGARQIMPYYGMPVGTDFEAVGFGYNKSIITGLLRERYRFDGIVCTDWRLISDYSIKGETYKARAWGVEHLSPRERITKLLDAGVDQFGGEAIPDLLVELVRSGTVSVARVDVSARRLLREKFLLGLFDNPFVDVGHAAELVGSAEFVAAGEAAQRASIAVLTNNPGASGTPILPFSRGLKLYVEGIAPELAATYGVIVSTPSEADLAVLRLRAPFEQRRTALENLFHAGSLDFTADVVAHTKEVASTTPTIIDVYLDRPAILTPLVTEVAAIVANWGATPQAVLDVLTGAAQPQGQLPFDLPSSMSAVEASRSDVPFDTTDPLFRFGHGLPYGAHDDQ